MRATVVLLPLLLACDPSPPVGAPRPDASVLSFDAAMLDPDDDRVPGTPLDAAMDAAPPAPRDAGRDTGPITPRDAGPPPSTRFVCRGVARSCSTTSTFSCGSQLGCRIGGDCGGISRSCYSLYSSYSCAQQDGCYWSSYRDDCSGSAWLCSSYSSELSCERQEGCSWRDECEGVAWSCSDFFTSESCFGQLGCRWEEA